MDGVPYTVKAIPFNFNGEKRFRVKYNNGPEHIFTWDSSIGRVIAIDNESSVIPANVKEAIGEKITSHDWIIK